MNALNRSLVGVTLLLALQFGACQSPQAIVPSPSLNTTPSSPLTATPGPTPTLANSTGTEFFLDELLLVESPGCKLPCWQGIVPGESSEVEVQEALKSVFGIDILDSHAYDLVLLNTVVDNPVLSRDYYTRPYAWYVVRNDQTAADFILNVDIDRLGNSLQLLRLKWFTEDTSLYKIHLSPMDVIESLGPPDIMLASPEPWAGPYVSVRLVIVYLRGIVVDFIQDAIPFDLVRTRDGEIENRIVDLCLDTKDTGLSGGPEVLLGDVYLLAPFPADMEDWSVIQRTLVDSIEEKYDPIEDVFGVTVEEIVTRAQVEEDVCLTLDLSY